ncbi:hypothetical protein FOZ63_004559 [Perkinsus olseni]|uniref:Uncharacterized protein n=1 Tax=Perkinsus olseni TaxID=32597 RepID=A0A7J6QKS5_PEROL|nr:hypothetical protein FOZ63_004559 [Perkinsus olseni]
MMAANVQGTEQVYEQHAEPYDGAYGMSPMPQYGDAPVAMWQSVPIAPPLPSARDIASMDFQQAFVHKCLYPSQSFLVSEGFAEHEEEKEGPEKRDEVAETKVRTPRLPREPQPDYFGHLLGHPISADDDEDLEAPLSRGRFFSTGQAMQPLPGGESPTRRRKTIDFSTVSNDMS